jgi:putative MFS transporter
VASEHFGTNLRATVATTVPNFVRGSLVPISLAFDFVYRKLQNGPNAETALIDTFLVITPIILLISFWSLYNLKETFGKDLDYLEDNKLIAG